VRSRAIALGRESESASKIERGTTAMTIASEKLQVSLHARHLLAFVEIDGHAWPQSIGSMPTPMRRMCARSKQPKCGVRDIVIFVSEKELRHQ
jgi:hypothetical protein